MLLLSSADFFKINFFKKFFQEYHQIECQKVWIQIRPDVLSGLIWVQTFCKGYQQMKIKLVSKEVTGFMTENKFYFFTNKEYSFDVCLSLKQNKYSKCNACYICNNKNGPYSICATMLKMNWLFAYQCCLPIPFAKQFGSRSGST